MLRRGSNQLMAGVCTSGVSIASAHHNQIPFFIPAFSAPHRNIFNHMASSSTEVLHAPCSCGAAIPPPSDCDVVASLPLFCLPSKPLQQRSKDRENIGANEPTTNLHLVLHLSSIRLAKMGPSKGRGPLIAKYAPVGFKKGFGAVGLGRHTKKGFFLINPMLIPKLHVPENIKSELKPYVSPEVFKIATQKFWDEESNPLS